MRETPPDLAIAARSCNEKFQLLFGMCALIRMYILQC